MDKRNFLRVEESVQLYVTVLNLVPFLEPAKIPPYSILAIREHLLVFTVEGIRHFLAALSHEVLPGLYTGSIINLNCRVKNGWSVPKFGFHSRRFYRLFLLPCSMPTVDTISSHGPSPNIYPTVEEQLGTTGENLRGWEAQVVCIQHIPRSPDRFPLGSTKTVHLRDSRKASGQVV